MNAPTASPPPRLGIYVVVVLINFVAAAGLTTLYLMLATLYREYADSPSGVGWAVTTYLLVAAISAALCGRLGDILGRRRIVLAMLVVAGLGALTSGLFSPLWAVVAGCALQGVAGGLSPLAIGIAREHLPGDKVPLALGVIAASGMFGAGISYLLGGVIVEHFSTHGGFFFKLLLAGITFVAVVMIVPRPTRPPASLAGIDLVRGSLFAPALGALLLAVQFSREWGFGSVRFIGLTTTGALLLAYWLAHQARQPRPLINVRMLATRRLVLTNLATVFVALGCVQLGQTLSLLLQQPAWTGIGLGLSPTALGWVLLPLNALSVVLSPLSSWYGKRAGDHNSALLGALLAIAAWVMLIFFHATPLQIMAAAVLSTCGYAVLAPALYNLIARATPVESASEAAGANYVLFASFMAVGSQVIFGILDGARVADPANTTVSYPAVHAWTTEFGFIALMCLLCFLVLLPLRGGARMAPVRQRRTA